MKFGSVFAGIGGFDLGFERAGLECAWQIEINPYSQRILEKHWKGVKRLADVRECGKHNLAPIDILVGGFPCTNISTAGNREGLAGDESRLWYEFHRIVTELYPRWVIIENVPGLSISNSKRDFAIVLGGLTGIIPSIPIRGWGNAGFARGPLYKLAYRVFDAQFFGVPQHRERMFIVGNLRDGSSAKVLFEQETFSGVYPQSKKPASECAGTLVSRIKAGGFPGEDGGLAGYIAADEYGPRRLTPLECERIQGFPDRWTEGLSDKKRYQLLGLAVPPPVTEWIGRRINGR